MADENLSGGLQIRPAASPVSTFVRPLARTAAEPAKPWGLPEGPKLNTIQRGGVGSVQTNPARELYEAMLPFNRQLNEFVGNAAQGYVLGQIAAGERDAAEFNLKNEAAKAALVVQGRIEADGADYQDTVREVRKSDPTAAEFLSQGNPYRLAGRRRVMAQLAGSEIDNALDSNYVRDRNKLVTYPEGGEELGLWKTTQTSEILKKYGLQEQYPEVLKYVLPKLNTAWDKVTERHMRDRQDVVDMDSGVATSATLTSTLTAAAQRGDVTVQDPKSGQTAVLKTGSVEWEDYYQRQLTALLDIGVAQVDPAKRGAWLKERFEQMKAELGVTPEDPLYRLIAGIRIGQSQLPYETRQMMGAAMAGDIREAQRENIKWQREQAEAQYLDAEAVATRDWFSNVAPTLGTAEFAGRRDEWIARNPGLGAKTNELAIKLAGQAADYNQGNSDPLEFGEFLGQVESAPATGWNPEQARKQGMLKIRRAGGTPEQMATMMGQLNSAIEQKNKQVETRGVDANKTIGQAVKTDLEQYFPDGMKALAKRVSGLGGDIGSLQGTVRQFGDRAVNYATEQLTKLYDQELDRVYGAWEEKYKGSPITPSQRAQLNADAIYRVRQSAEYKKLFAPQQQALDPGAKPQPQQAAVYSMDRVRLLPEQEARRYRSQAIVSGQSLRVAINYALENDGRVGNDTAAAARRAGVSPLEFLRGQLPFYEALDPRGEVKRWLDQKLKGTRQQTQAAAQSVAPSIQQAVPPPAPVLPADPQARGGPDGGSVSSMVTPAARATVQGNPFAGSGMAVAPTGSYGPGNWLYDSLNGGTAGVMALRVLGFSGQPLQRPGLMDSYVPAAQPMGGISGGVSTQPFTPVLALLRSGEGGWDSANRGIAGDTPGGIRGLSKMTLGQWKQYQSQGYNALGAYQFIPRTLQLAAKEAGISDSTVMTPAVQDRLAVQLMIGSKRPELAKYLRGQSNNVDRALDDLALEWASVATRSGGTAYPTVGGNRASIGRDRARQVLQQARASFMGANGAAAGLDLMSRPRAVLPREVTSSYGMKESFRRHAHEGVDVGLDHGTPLALAVGGTVVNVYRTNSTAREANGGYGSYIDVRLANGSIVRMAHLSQIPAQLKPGAAFGPNQVLAYSGGAAGKPGSGRSSGAHLHMEHLTRAVGQQETLNGKQDPQRSGALGLLRVAAY